MSSSAKKRVVISACLLGEYCRYDGKTKEISAVAEAYKGYEIIPFCPEAPLFGTPRERINIVEIAADRRLIQTQTQEDVTQLLADAIEQFCQKTPQVDAIVLKSKSPSCGHATTPILNEKEEVIAYGDGIAVTLFKNFYKNIPLEDEISFIK